jgi:two-component system chemotaxis response regulator CheB
MPMDVCYLELVYAGVHKPEDGCDAPVEIVGIAGSAGGIEALRELLGTLPADFPCPIVIAQHLGPVAAYRSALHCVLRSQTVLCVKWAEEGEFLRAGSVFLAPQDQHVQITFDRRIRLIRSGKVNGSRPAADPLFASIAREYGARGAGVILSGCLWDGAEGAYQIGAAGGRILVQDPKTSQMGDMPLAAIRTGAVHFKLSPEMIGRALITLAMAPGAAAWFQVWPKALKRHSNHPASPVLF